MYLLKCYGMICERNCSTADFGETAGAGVAAAAAVAVDEAAAAAAAAAAVEVVEALGYVIWVTEVSGTSVAAPLTTSKGAPPADTFEESIADTVPTTGAFPFVPGNVTWVPRKELAVASPWVWLRMVVCWRVLNCANCVMVWVGSIGCIGS